MFGFDTVRSRRLGNCAQCGREVAVNVQLLSDAGIVCARCRCSVCRIVLSEEVCRCGIAHGKPSALKQVCERCYALLQAGAFKEPSLGIVADAVHSFEQGLTEDELLNEEFSEMDEEDVPGELVVAGDDQEFQDEAILNDSSVTS